MSNLTNEQRAEIERVRMAFPTNEWLTVEEILRADEWHTTRPAVFAMGWQSDKERIADHLVASGALRRQTTCPVRYRRVGK